MPNLKKIPVAELKVGMYLYALSGSWIEHPFWRSKFIIEDPNDILLIEKSTVLDAWIDVEKSVGDSQGDRLCTIQFQSASDSANAEHRLDLETNPTQPTSMAVEIDHAKKIRAYANKTVKSIFDDARAGKPVSLEGAREAVQEIVFSVMRNPGAMISVVRSKTAGDYLAMHSVAVCALMIALARQLKLGDSEVREAGLAGILHDLGEVDTPGEILNRPGALTENEFAVVKHHAVQGHCLLVEGGQMSGAVLDVCLHHHERLNGSGYPFGLSGGQISRLARMAAICDVYDAITSSRPHKKSLGPAEAIRLMTQWGAEQYDQNIFQAFVDCVGMYPVGSLVRLSSGKLGVVVEQNADSPTTPKVKIFFAPEAGFCTPPETIDLSLGAVEERSEKIVGCEDAAKWDVKNLDRMWAD